MSDSTPAPPKDPRLVQAELLLAESNARKAAAEAMAAEVSAYLPDLSSLDSAGALTPPEGTPPIATVAAYRALSAIGKRIAAELSKSTEGETWIVPDGDYRTVIDTHDALVSQVGRLSKLADQAVREVSAGAVDRVRAFGVMAGISLAVAAAPLLISLFTKTRTILAKDVSLEFTAAAAAVVEAVGKVSDDQGGATSTAVATRSVHVLGISRPDSAALQPLIKALQEKRDRLEKALVRARGASGVTSVELKESAKAEAWKGVLLEQSKKEPMSDSITVTIDKIVDAVGAANDARTASMRQAEVVKSAESLLQTIDHLLQEVDGASGSALVALSAAGAALTSANVLVLQPTYAGAEAVYEDVKLGRDKALYLGSSVVTWFLLDKGARPLRAAVEYADKSASMRIGDPDVTWAAS